MTTLTIHDAKTGLPKRATITNADEIVSVLETLGIAFERWPLRRIAANAAPDEVLKLYKVEVDKLNEHYGFQSVDAIRLLPDAPNAAEMRGKFLDEHVHDDDEIRFFVEGAGAFYIRTDEAVYQIVCTAGDLIAVPRGTRHWFDTGEKPNFTAIRFFTKPDGWQARFTGDDIAKRIPLFTQAAA